MNVVVIAEQVAAQGSDDGRVAQRDAVELIYYQPAGLPMNGRNSFARRNLRGVPPSRESERDGAGPSCRERGNTNHNLFT